MAERKVLNKYYAPDFDPSKVPRRKIDYDAKMEIRMMLPFNMCCLTCGHYMYRGKKFNSKKETAKGEDYLGIKIIRFYVKCEACRAQITFKTDPKNGDYTCESGASRNFEIWRQTGDDANKELVEQAPEEEKNAIETLEQRTLESKREMDILDALDEIQAVNRGREKVTSDQVLDKLTAKERAQQTETKKQQEDEIDSLARAAFQQKRSGIKRLKDSDEEGSDPPVAAESAPTKAEVRMVKKIIRKKKKKRTDDGDVGGPEAISSRQGSDSKQQAQATSDSKQQAQATSDSKQQTPSSSSAAPGLSSLVGYGSSSSDEDSS